MPLPTFKIATALTAAVLVSAPAPRPATRTLHVVITAVGGRQFSTSDGGQTWLEIR
jgi:hypothetical protein